MEIAKSEMGKQDFDEKDGKGDEQYPTEADVGTDAEAYTIEEQDAEEGLTNVARKSHASGSGKESGQRRLAESKISQYYCRHVAESQRKDAERIECGMRRQPPWMMHHTTVGIDETEWQTQY